MTDTRDPQMPAESAFERLQTHARLDPDRAAIIEHWLDGAPQATSFEALARSARRFASAFERRVPPGTIIPLALSRSAECIAAMLGAIGSGHAFACLSPKLRTPQIAGILEETRSPVALIDSAGLMSLRGGIKDHAAIAATTWWLIDDARFGHAQRRAADTLARAAAVEPWRPEQQGEMTAQRRHDEARSSACVLFTSGSTGRQRGVLISAKNLRVCAEAEAALYELTPDDRLLSLLPFAFDVGLMQVLSAMHSGSTLVLLNSWLPTDVLHVAAAQRITGISAVPSIWSDLIAHDKIFDTNREHAPLRYITISGGDLSPRQLTQLPLHAPGVGIYKTYGQSEDFRTSALRPGEFSSRPRSVGRAYGDAKIYVVRDDGSLASPGETGEVVHAGMGTMLGYLGGDDAHKLRANPFRRTMTDPEVAVFTGDIGWLDDDGFLFLEGRRDDLVKIHGNRVYLAEVRNHLSALELVKQAEVVAVDDEGRTQLTAFVVLADDATIPALKAALCKSAPSYMVPALIVARSQLPRTANGKPDRQALVAEARALLGDADKLDAEVG